jgi:hypothetical protein
MKDVIESIKTVIYRMLAARGLVKYKEGICRTIVTSEAPTVTRKLKVIYTIEETIDVELPAEPWTSSNRTILIEEILRTIQEGIGNDTVKLYLCDDNKRICSLCGWYLEEFYSCTPCNDPCSNCDIIPSNTCQPKEYSCG